MIHLRSVAVEAVAAAGAPLAPVAWDELEHVRLVRDFLNRPDSFLRHP